MAKVKNFGLNNEKDDESEEEIDLDFGFTISDEVVSEDVGTIVKLLWECQREKRIKRKELRNKLEECDVKPSNELVLEILSQVRND
ncbi:unnamed protein product [Arabidopsis halleri]